MHGIVSETFDIHILDIFVDTWYSCVLVAYLDSLYLPYLTFEVDTTRGSIQRSGHNLDSLCLSVILQLQEVYIQLTSLRWLVFCRCFEKNCTLHFNVVYFQTIYILSSNFTSVIFSQPVSWTWRRCLAALCTTSCCCSDCSERSESDAAWFESYLSDRTHCALVNHQSIFFEKYTVRNNNKTKPNRQPTNPRIVTAGWLALVISMVVVDSVVSPWLSHTRAVFCGSRLCLVAADVVPNVHRWVEFAARPFEII